MQLIASLYHAILRKKELRCKHAIARKVSDGLAYLSNKTNPIRTVCFMLIHLLWDFIMLCLWLRQFKCPILQFCPSCLFACSLGSDILWRKLSQYPDNGQRTLARGRHLLRAAACQPAPRLWNRLRTRALQLSVTRTPQGNPEQTCCS